MGRQILRCDAVPKVDRRSLLLGLAGVAALAPAAAARPASSAALGDLITAEGVASGLARSLAGTSLSLRGYLAPSLDGRDFPLGELSTAPCGLCGNLHDAGRFILVRAEQPNAPLMQLVEVEGRLEVDEATAAGVRFRATSIRAI